MHIRRVRETSLCEYTVDVCVPNLCSYKPEETSEELPQEGGDEEPLQPPPPPAPPTRRQPVASAAKERHGSYAGSDRRSTAAARAGASMDKATRLANREAVRAMFVHAYDGYMYHGFPHGELAPLSCGGQAFDMIKIPAVTLVDTLDALVIMGNYTEFRRAVGLVSRALPQGLDFDVNVSVFETTIRILGGLLSAHIFATGET